VSLGGFVSISIENVIRTFPDQINVLSRNLNTIGDFHGVVTAIAIATARASHARALGPTHVSKAKGLDRKTSSLSHKAGLLTHLRKLGA
jgi:hypothetical protein